jgi:transposase
MFDIVAQQVWLASGATDMRKSIDGLAGIAQFVIRQDPLGKHLFVFCNKHHNSQ